MGSSFSGNNKEENYSEINIGQTISESDPFTEMRYLQFARLMRNNVEMVLDIGCNTGRGGQVLKNIKAGIHLDGLDCVEDRLRRLPAELYERKLLGFSTSISCADNTYDAVVAGEFIEHLYPDDVEKTFCEIFRVLKLGGQLLLTTPNPQSVWLRWRRQSVLGGAHLSQHYAHALVFRLQLMGFSRVKVYGSGRTSRTLGMHFPLLNLYGSYLLSAWKW